MNKNKSIKPNEDAVGATSSRLQGSRGITLIALIITIIVMLILVGVSIAIAINGNLFGITKEGARQITIEAYREHLEAIRVNAMMEQIKNNLTTTEFLEKVEEGVKNNSAFNESEIKRTGKSVKVTTKEGYVFKITEDKVVYMGLASEQGELTMNLSEANTKFIYEPSGWIKGPVKVSVETTVDAEELGAVLEYSIDGGNTWTEFSVPIQLENNGDEIYARLWNEEEEEEGSYAVGTVSNIDRLSPKLFVPTGTSTDTSITLTGKGIDSEATNKDGSSGIKLYYYSIDDGQTWEPQNGTSEESYTFNNLTDSTTYDKLKMKAVDYAENEVVTDAITVVTKRLNKPFVGDYVNYTPQNEVTSYTVEGKYSGYTSDQTINQETLKWKILNINEDGTIDLISETSTTATVYLQGALGYNNGVYLLNDLCNTLYSNSKYGATARSLNLEDIQDKMNLDVWDYHDYYDVFQYNETQTLSSGAYPYQWAQQKSEKNAIDGVLTAGTLTRSEQKELTTETYIPINESIIITKTYWEKAMNMNNFKTVSTRENNQDAGIYYYLFINNFRSWLSSRYEQLDETRGHFGLLMIQSNSVCSKFRSYARRNG